MPALGLKAARGFGAECYPYLIALCFPLNLWLCNLSDAPSGRGVVTTIVITMLVTVLLSALARPFFQNCHARSIAVSLLLICIFAYGLVFDQHSWTGWRHRHFITFWLPPFATALALLFRYRRANFRSGLSRCFCTTAVILLLVQVVSAVPQLSLAQDELQQRLPLEQLDDWEIVNSDDPAQLTRPDIYYIIVDGYARKDSLQKVVQFDNSEFIKSLQERGFYVPEKAHANYCHTHLSLPSSLSMQYLPVSSVIDEGYFSGNSREIHSWTKNSLVAQRLRKIGYRYRHVGSGFYSYRVDESADENLVYDRGSSDYLLEFVFTTAIAPVLGKASLLRFVFDYAKFHEHQFKYIPRSKNSSDPLFTFAHILCPHPPYVFRRHGRRKHASPNKNDAAAYVEQLQYLNGRLLEMIDEIDRTSGNDAVIIIQADHGTWFWGYTPETPTQDQLFERMSILAAYRYPPKARAELYSTITPVNSFRVLFNNLFGDSLPLLKDRALYSQGDFHFTTYDWEKTASRDPLAGSRLRSTTN
jgi:hypothetical protein